jgi:hypothetical protein
MKGSTMPDEILTHEQVKALLNHHDVEGTWSMGVKALRLHNELCGAVFAWKRKDGWHVEYTFLRDDSPFRARILRALDTVRDA